MAAAAHAPCSYATPSMVTKLARLTLLPHQGTQVRAYMDARTWARQVTTHSSRLVP